MKNFIYILLIIPCIAKADVIETWECNGIINVTSEKPMVVAHVHDGRDTGEIEVAGVIYNTIFSLEGFDRRWDFEQGGDSLQNYSLIVKPNGFAAYYVFRTSEPNEKADPNMALICKMK